ncbi:hypothetical protein GCM10027200_01870 [Lentzea nigeriaca]
MSISGSKGTGTEPLYRLAAKLRHVRQMLGGHDRGTGNGLWRLMAQRQRDRVAGSRIARWGSSTRRRGISSRASLDENGEASFSSSPGIGDDWNFEHIGSHTVEIW